MAANNYLSNLTYCANDVRDLRDLIRESLYTDENFLQYVNLLKVKNGEKAAFIGDLDDVGLAGAGCDPTYVAGGMANSEKTWDLGDWHIAIKICYTVLNSTIAEYTLKTGTDIHDLTSTEFMNVILRPALDKALRVMIWRLGWFGNTSAQNITDGGVITDGVDVDLLKACNGLFVRLGTIVTNDSNRLTAIAANSQTTYATQKSAILTSGVATGIIDSMLFNAPAKLNSDPDRILLLSGRLADALAADVKATYKAIMPWESVFEGFDIAEYDGVKVARIRIWDQLIDKFENTTTAWNKPFRAVYSTVRNLGVGTNADDLFSDFDIYFDHKDRNNYIYAAGKMDTMVFDDDKVQVAW